MSREIPALEDRERAVCPVCGFVDYVNPICVVGTVPVAEDGRVLLCLRNIEPRKGYWTLPAGFLEAGETAPEGAIRETHEEAGARVELGRLYSVIDVVRAQQLHLFWRARLLDLRLSPGAETIENRLFAADEIPWEELSFGTVRRTLEHWVSDRHGGTFELHEGSIR